MKRSRAALAVACILAVTEPVFSTTVTGRERRWRFSLKRVQYQKIRVRNNTTKGFS
jgi:hypothetical protein